MFILNTIYIYHVYLWRARQCTLPKWLATSPLKSLEWLSIWPRQKPVPLGRPVSSYTQVPCPFSSSSITLPRAYSMPTCLSCSSRTPSMLPPQGLSTFFLPLPGTLSIPDIRWLTPSFPSGQMSSVWQLLWLPYVKL